MFDGDLTRWPGEKPACSIPTGELPRIKRRLGALMRGLVPRRLEAPRLLDGDEPFQDNETLDDFPDDGALVIRKLLNGFELQGEIIGRGTLALLKK